MKLQRELDKLGAHGGTLHVPSGLHIIETPISLRGREGVRLVGDGLSSRLVFLLGPDFADVEGLALFDLTGANDCEISQLSIYVARQTEVAPASAVLLARESQNSRSAMQHRFERLSISGRYTTANVVNYGSELSRWDGCKFLNDAPGGGNYVTGRWPAESLKSIGGGSNLDHLFTGCAFGVYGRTGSEVNVTVGSGTGWLKVCGGCMSNKVGDAGGQGGRAGFQIGGSQSRAVEQVSIDGLQAETTGATHCIETVGLTVGLSVCNSQLCAVDSPICFNGHTEDSRLSHNTMVSENGAPYVSVRDTFVGNLVDLKWKQLARLDRDKPGRGLPQHALEVRSDKLYWDNVVLLRRPADLLRVSGLA